MILYMDGISKKKRGHFLQSFFPSRLLVLPDLERPSSDDHAFALKACLVPMCEENGILRSIAKCDYLFYTSSC